MYRRPPWVTLSGARTWLLAVLALLWVPLRVNALTREAEVAGRDLQCGGDHGSPGCFAGGQTTRFLTRAVCTDLWPDMHLTLYLHTLGLHLVD